MGKEGRRDCGSWVWGRGERIREKRVRGERGGNEGGRVKRGGDKGWSTKYAHALLNLTEHCGIV